MRARTATYRFAGSEIIGELVQVMWEREKRIRTARIMHGSERGYSHISTTTTTKKMRSDSSEEHVHEFRSKIGRRRRTYFVFIPTTFELTISHENSSLSI